MGKVNYRIFELVLVILKRKTYLAVAIFATLLMYVLSFYLTVINVYGRSILIFLDMNGIAFTVASLSLSLVISVFFGIYIAMLFFRRKIVKARASANKATGSIGTFAGIIASGCPSCGTPLLGFIGIPLGLFSLPFNGLELKVLSIGLILLSIYLIGKNIRKSLVCEVNQTKK